MTPDVLPHDHDIERAVLACIVARPELIRACDFPSSAFYSDNHRAVYEALSQLDEDGFPADLKLLARQLRTNANITGPELERIVDLDTFPSHFQHYKTVLLRIAYQRQVVRIEEQTQNSAREGNQNPDEIEEQRDRLIRMAREEYWPPERGHDPEHAEEELRTFYTTFHEASLKTGLAELDHVVGDLYPGSVLTILARPGVGKSVLGLNMVARWLETPARWGVMFASLEMGLTLATDRLIRIMEGWTLSDIKHAMRANGVPENYRRRTRNRYAVYTRARSSLSAIASAMDAWERQHETKLQVLIVDYFQYLAGERGESLYEKGSRLSRELKELAKERDIIVVNLCQVKRGEEGGKGKDCPSLESARDSGTIEENADTVIGLWKSEGPPTMLKAKGLKVRQGESGRTADLVFDADTMRLA